MQAPEPRDRLAVRQAEHALLPVGPLDDLGAAVLVLQQLQQELPQVGRAALARLALAGDAVGADFGGPGRKEKWESNSNLI